MKVAAITTFPPSTFPHSSFAYHAVLRFIESPEINQVIVLADRVNSPEVFNDSKLTIDRCWTHDSLPSVYRLVINVIKHKPDVIWLSFHYTLFGVSPPIVIQGLLLTAVFRLLGYPVVLLLHNFLAMVKTDEIGYDFSGLSRIGMKWIDGIAMRSLMQANTVFVMRKEYKRYLSSNYPRSNVVFVEQDLYKVPDFVRIDDSKNTIMTVGYFGMHKRLDILLNAFKIIKQYLPRLNLRIAGRGHPRNATYIEDLIEQHRMPLNDGIEFIGYVDDREMPGLFWDANIVVATNISDTGSSAILRYAAVYGRGVVAPELGVFRTLRGDDWGIVYYKPENVESLAEALLSTLADTDKQVNLALANYQKALQSEDKFVAEHLRAFKVFRR